MQKTKKFWAGLLTLAMLLSVTGLPVTVAGAPVWDQEKSVELQVDATTFRETSEPTSGYVNGVLVGVSTAEPEGEITYTGIIGPNVTINKVFASITGKNTTSADVTGTLALTGFGGDGVQTWTTSKEVTFTANCNLTTSRFPVMARIENAYTPGENFVLTFTVGGEEVARFTKTSIVPNETDQLYRLPSDQVDAAKVAVDDSVWDWPVSLGDAKVARWDGDRIGAFSITIDDDLFPDHSAWRMLSKRYDIPVSWVIVSNNSSWNIVDGVPTKSCVSEANRADWEMGLRYESHSYSHWTLPSGLAQGSDERLAAVIKEAAGSQETISRLTGGDMPLLFGFPGGVTYYDGEQDVVRDYFIGGRTINGGDTLSNGADISQSTIENLILSTINTSVKYNNANWYGGNNYCYFHSIGSSADDKGAAITLRTLHQHADQVWGGRAVDVARYVAERSTATLTTKSASEDQIVLSLTDKMFDEIYTYPLTLKVNVADSWEGIKVTQNGAVSYGTLQTKDGDVQALIQAVPDQGDIIVEPCTAAEALSGTPQDPSLSEAKLNEFTYQADTAVALPVPGFTAGQEGGNYVISVPADTKTVNFSTKNTYYDAVATYSQSNGILDVSGNGDHTFTVTVASANGNVTNTYNVTVQKSAIAPPAVESVLWVDRFNNTDEIPPSSTDKAKWNQWTGAAVWADPSDLDNNYSIHIQAGQYDAAVMKNYLAPTRGEIALSFNLYFPSDAAMHKNFHVQFGGKDVLTFVWDGTGAYKWYVVNATGTQGGTVVPGRKLAVSLHIQAAETGDLASARWGNSTVTAIISQAGTDGKVVTNSVVQPQVLVGWNDANTYFSSKFALDKATSQAAMSEVYVDDILYYNPVSNGNPLPTPTVEPTSEPTSTPIVTVTPAPTAAPTPSPDPSNAKLSALTYQANGGSVKTVSGFLATDETKTYNVVLPKNTTSVTVGATAASSSANIVRTPSDGIVNVSGGSGSATIAVTSEDQTKINTYTILFTVSQEADPVYSKIYKYHFDYSWVTPGTGLTTNSTDAGNDGAASGGALGRWAGTHSGTPVWDPADPTNKCYKISYISNYIDGDLIKNKLKPSAAFVVSGKIRLDATSYGKAVVRFAGKDLITFNAASLADDYTWSVGTMASGGKVARDTWVKYDIYVQPNGTDWTTATLTGYVSGAIKNALGEAVGQIETVQQAFDTGHDGISERSFVLMVPRTQKGICYVDDVHLYQPGLMSVSAVTPLTDVSPDDNFIVKMLSGDTPVGADVATGRRMGQDLDLSTLSTSAVSIVPVGGGSPVTPAVIADPAKPDTFTLNFAGSPLAGNTTYNLVIGEGILDVAGHSVNPDVNSITFTTGAGSSEPTASPTITPMPTTTPPIGGYVMPDAYNTGPITPVEDLEDIKTKYPKIWTGSRIIIKESHIAEYGNVFEGFKSDTMIELQADNVVIRDFYINIGNSNYYCVKGTSTYVLNSFTAEDGELVGSTSDMISVPKSTLRRLHMHDAYADFLKPISNWVVESCYMHDAGKDNYLAHADGLQISGGNATTLQQNIRILGNRIDMPQLPLKYASNACVFVKMENGGATNIEISYNWLNGGGYTTFLVANGYSLTNVFYSNNRIGAGYSFSALTKNMPVEPTMGGNILLDTADVPNVGSIVYKDTTTQSRIHSLSGSENSVTALINFANYTLREQPISIVAELLNSEGSVVKTVPFSTSIPRYIPKSEYLSDENVEIVTLPNESGIDTNYKDLITMPDLPSNVQREVTLTQLPQLISGYSVRVSVYGGEAGDTLLRTDTLYASADAPVAAYGDINADGVIDIADVVMAAEIAVGYTNYTPEQRIRANVSSKTDITVDVADVIMIAERAVGNTYLFPVEEE